MPQFACDRSRPHVSVSHEEPWALLAILFFLWLPKTCPWEEQKSPAHVMHHMCVSVSFFRQTPTLFHLILRVFFLVSSWFRCPCHFTVLISALGM